MARPSPLATLIMMGLLAPAVVLGGPSADTLMIDGRTVNRSTTDQAGAFLKTIDTFTVTDAGCRIAWVVSVPSEHECGSKGLMLSTRFPEHAGCPPSFDAQRPLHQAAIKAVLSTWPAADFDSYTCPSFATMAPGGEWNAAIARAALGSADYQDYRRNYPHHTSGKHINTLFVEIANTARAYRDLESLFADNGLQLILTHVEKVFSDTVGAIKQRQALPMQGLPDGERVLYDAGIYNFSLRPRMP